MSVTDYAIPTLALALVLFDFDVFFEEKPNIKKTIILAIGVLTFGFSLWSSHINSKASDKLRDANDSLLVSQHRVEDGQKDLKIEQLKNDIAQKIMSESQKSLMNKIYEDDSTNAHHLGEKLETLKHYSDSLAKIQPNPADIELLPEPHNVFNYTCNDTTDITAVLQIENLGSQVAYGITYDLYYIVKMDGNYYKLTVERNVNNNTLSPGIMKRITNTISLDNDGKRVSICNKIQELYCFLIGKYYLDDKHKTKKDIVFGISKEANDETSSIWDYNKPVKKFINDALGKFSTTAK